MQDAASVASALWVSYLEIMVYIAIAVGAVTHVDLFLERPVKLPLLGDTPLPLLAFFILAPIAFIIWHAYTLLHFGILAEKVTAFAATPGYREDYLWRLPANIFLQLLVGPPALRKGRIGFVSAAIAWISLVIGPILLLLAHRDPVSAVPLLGGDFYSPRDDHSRPNPIVDALAGSGPEWKSSASARKALRIVLGCVSGRGRDGGRPHRLRSARPTFPGEWMEQYGGAK